MVPDVSIIIVHYKVKKILFNCIWSILKVKSDIKAEIIVVDNDEKKTIGQELINKFPFIKYIKSPGNIGYGAGMNLGAKDAKGRYLYILNPDTIILNNNIKNLVTFLNKHDEYAIAAPQLMNKHYQVYELQGVKKLTFLRAIFVLSFINKYFPNNWIAGDYWQKNWNKKQIKNVDVVPGSAFVIRRSIYEKIKGFDEKFFLYFEEFDLCNRVKKMGYKIAIVPDSKIIHFWGKSTAPNSKTDLIFKNSRQYYFTKNYGSILSKILDFMLNITPVNIILFFVLTLTIGIRLYNLPHEMFFIGDQAWFYLSAKNMIVDHIIPLVGITSSHVWLHQGPLWTYVLAIGLLIFHFNPLAGAAISALSALATSYLLYRIGNNFFGYPSGIIAAFFYATSPLGIMFDRMPYHTTLIPFAVSLLIFFIFNWINNKPAYFPWVLFMLSLLYNLEISTSLFFAIVSVLLVYGYKKNTKWWKSIQNSHIILKSIVLLIIPLVPMLIYDIGHGFPQTFGYMAWIIYKILQLLSLHHSGNPLNSLTFLWIAYNQAILPGLIYIAVVISLFSGFYLIYSVYKYRNIYLNSTIFILLVLLIGFIGGGVNSQAYLPMFLPLIFLLEGYIFAQAFVRHKISSFVITVLLIFLGVSNIKTAFSKMPFYPQISYADRLISAKSIIKQSGGESYSLLGKGTGSQFASFTMNMQYLTWWLGKPEKMKNSIIKFVISENKTIKINKVVNY